MVCSPFIVHAILYNVIYNTAMALAGLATPPGTWSGLAVRRNAQLPLASHALDNASVSHSSPMGHPSAARRCS